jgi:hypothetical protein
MFHTLRITILAFLVLSLPLPAQEAKKATPVRFRAVLHDPVNPAADLFYTDPSGAVLPLNFRPKDLSETLLTLPLNGSLVLYDKAQVDPENPAASLAASVRMPSGTKRVMVVVLPSPPGKKPAYQMLLIDDSEKSFPQGESRVIPLIGEEIGLQAGEHRLTAKPGIITRVPPVKRVNDYNMAQTNFHYRQGDSWIAFTERQLQYLDASRRLFIIHATPGALTPTVTTIVDTSQATAP